MQEPRFRIDTRDVVIILGIMIFFGILVIGYFQSLGENPIIQGEPAPDFSLQDLNGDMVQLSRLQGKVVVLNFMSRYKNFECENKDPALGCNLGIDVAG